MHELGLRFYCASRRNYRKRHYMALYTRISTRRYSVHYGEAVLCCRTLDMYIVLGFHPCDVTMQRTKTNFMADVVEKIGSKLLSWFSIHSVFHRLYWWILSFTKYMIASQLILMFCINLNLIYILCWGGLKIDFGFVISILCFRRSPQQGSLRPLPCDVECSDFLPVLLVSDFGLCSYRCKSNF